MVKTITKYECDVCKSQFDKETDLNIITLLYYESNCKGKFESISYKAI